MRKSTKIVKRLLALFLVVLMSINTMGAVVSDNDGAAFITKAEFDSLKNDFQSQIDQYNTSIDAKIDGAIAAYLAGLMVQKKGQVESVLNKINAASTVTFTNNVKEGTLLITKLSDDGYRSNVEFCRMLFSKECCYNFIFEKLYI